MKLFAKPVKFLLVFLIITFVLTGCTTGNNSGTSSSAPTSDKVSIQWWGVFFDEEVVQSLIDEYQEANQNVEIKYVNKWPGGERNIAAKLYQDEIDRVLKNNNPVEIPDIFMVQNTWVGNYEKFTAPAKTELSIDTFKTAFYPAVVKDFAQGDVVRGVPLWMDAISIIYNKDILSQAAVSAPPTNWPDFKNLAISLTQRSGSQITRAGFAAGTTNNVSFGFDLLNLLLLQNGVAITDSQNDPIFSTDSDSVTALSFYQSFAANTGSWSATMKNDAIEFLEGDLAMMAAPSWRYHDLLRFNELYSLGINMGIAPMPQLQGQSTPTINWASYWGNMVALNRPYSEESWKFLKWISEPAQLRKLRANAAEDSEFFSFLYPRVDMQQDLQRDNYLRTYNSALSTAETWYMVDGLAVESIFKSLIDAQASSSSVAAAENQVQSVVDAKGRL